CPPLASDELADDRLESQHPRSDRGLARTRARADPGGGVKREKPIPTSRLRRTAKVGELVGGQTVRAYATRPANLTRSPAGREAAAARRQIEEAEKIVDILGHM